MYLWGSTVIASASVVVPRSGNYKLKAVLREYAAPEGMRVRINGGAWIDWSTATQNEWAWFELPTTLVLGAGANTVEFSPLAGNTFPDFDAFAIVAENPPPLCGQ